MSENFKLDFVGIGVAKAGTSWIAMCLSEHPQVCIGIGKELDYFLRENIVSMLPVKNRFYSSSHFSLGPAWLESRFERRKPGQLCGEYSNAYLSAPDCADLIYEHNPRAKLIVSFRNPVDVVQSAFHDFSRVQPLPDTIEETLEKYPQMLRYGRFFENLEPFLKRFPREQFHYLLYDDIKQDAPAAFRGICRYLGIDETFAPPSLTRRVNARVVLRSKAVRNLRAGLSSIMSSSPGMRKLRTGIFRSPVGKAAVWAFRLNEKEGKPPGMKPESRAHLMKLYRDDVEKLQDFLGRDLSSWLRERPAPNPAA